jgi:hypothetical protein
MRNGRSYPRSDGWTRPAYLATHLTAIADLVAAGVPVAGYYHWSLADNYEWGSYEPRFGLYGIDRARGMRWLHTDSMGHDAAGSYRRLIEAMRDGDRDRLSAEADAAVTGSAAAGSAAAGSAAAGSAAAGSAAAR